MLSETAIAPGSVVIVRDEEWLVTKMETSDGVTLLSVQGLSGLVRGTRATFLDSLDKIEVFDPATASLVADESPSYRRARLWLEAIARKTPIPLADRQLTVSTEALALAQPPRGFAPEGESMGTLLKRWYGITLRAEGFMQPMREEATTTPPLHQPATPGPGSGG